MKKISVCIACYNEEENIVPLTDKVVEVLKSELPYYDYEIVISDNCSEDNTRSLIREICSKNKRVKAIFNTRNFGPENSWDNCSNSTTGDCIMSIFADFQTPPELIPQFVKEWESGYKIVAGVKINSRENILMRLVRSIYYKLIDSFSSYENINNFCGFQLVDRSITELGRVPSKYGLHYGRGFLAHLGHKVKKIPYIQPKRRAGKSSYNFYRYWDAAMLGFTSSTKGGLRIATFSGMIMGTISFIIAVIYLVLKLLYWDSFNAGYAPLIIGVFLLGSFQLFFIGLLGEYIMAINTRQMKWPPVVEEERINFEKT
ncbi:MAG: glycosyltransferase family 2 protein [Termitinemataceae bacterium]|nr:MAG: glycosyltransferase family 2 protein [Termitinemataceae bacterium]